MLPRGRFHPFQLDTFGLGAVIDSVNRHGAQLCLMGIGGSATNDGGFGLARAVGWQFLDREGQPIERWIDLAGLSAVRPPAQGVSLRGNLAICVAVDVQNKLLGPKGASHVYGPQKGLKPSDVTRAERALGRLASITARFLRTDFSKRPGAGAAGGSWAPGSRRASTCLRSMRG
jgi:glycerate 2-kinase